MKTATTVLTVFCLCRWEATKISAQTFLLKTEEAGMSVIKKNNGVAVADYDRDGDLDVYFVANQQYNADDASTWNRFFRNEGNGTFTDVTAVTGVISRVAGQPFNEMGYKFGAAWGDYDNDSYPDIFLTNYGLNELYHNQGDGTFANVTQAAGVGGEAGRSHSSAVWWDYDLDGDLDLYVSAWRGANTMYENNGNGTFTDVTQQSGLINKLATWTSIPLDANNDGLPDLYVVDDFKAPNKFFLNLGNKTFREATQEFGLISPGNGMGVSVGDYNNDGFFDIYVTNISGLAVFDNETNPLFTNTGQGRFVDRAAEMGVAIAGWGWGNEFFDCDHDGDLDLYAVNGFDFNGRAADTSNFFFENIMETGTILFKNISAQCGAGGWADGLGLVVFDYDNDGDLDLLVSNSKQEPYLYENRSHTQNWLKIQLEGTISNRNAFGAVVKLTAGGKNYYRQHDGVSFLGQSIKPLHFGLAEAPMIEEIAVRWPNGNEETVVNVAANQTIKIKEGQGMVTGVKQSAASVMPDEFQLLGNFPNPFNNNTAIKFNLGQPGEIKVVITDVVGREIRTIHTGFSTSGTHVTHWNATDDNGEPVGSGLYFYKVFFQSYSRAGKILYLK
ncbi:FG-GAP-like repeat-containing protein [candidate division KSB1 bacterium]|nr:FG-GAP-like repeat-containing protein [candidate division KSB1 bacterium]